MPDLPPDLSRLGDELTVAVSAASERRRRRTRMAARLAVTVAAAAAAFSALTPQASSPGGQRPLLDLDAAVASAGEPPERCDRPSGVRFRPACLRQGTGDG